MRAKRSTKKSAEQPVWGPRELKEPTSREYAVQTLFMLKRYLESVEIDEERVVTELERVERYRHWEVLGYASRDAMLEAEGVADRLKKRDLGRLLDGRERAADPALPSQPRRGEIGKGRVRSDIIRPNGHGTSAEYLLRRLKRDRPDLVERVASGEIRSARAAAIEAGIVRVPTAFDQLMKAWRKATPEERERFVRECVETV